MLRENVQELYQELAKICLAQIILFNRRRSCEAQMITVQEFLNAKTGCKIDPVVRRTLTCFEQTLCDTHMRIEIVGKRG
ncbi:hypothetical protein KUTeg_005688 [Tegillarca granosa]|uniref:Uncharacterized protein n=1 Tax=Tegillarca granosa TaxID=220873 RepID=A0ABQ9FJL7_TEGGR|nr:hypothetical protein KUTeg_005688 [Tegillarca granosa]